MPPVASALGDCRRGYLHRGLFAHGGSRPFPVQGVNGYPTGRARPCASVNRGGVDGMIRERDPLGLPTAGASLERFCCLVAAAVSVWLLMVGLWEIAGPFGAGHAAVVPARGIIAENMLEWGVLGPVRTYTVGRPGPEMIYANHPWGSFWLQAVSMSLFGRHELTFRVLPVLLTATMPWLLWALGRALYSPPAGAIAALGYGSLPIVLGFANFPGFEGPVSFCCVLVAWASLRLMQTGQRRWLATACLGFLLGYHTDWGFYVFAGFTVVAFVVLHGGLPRAWFGTVNRGALAVWAASATTIGVASLGFYCWAFEPAGGFEALMAQGRFRAGTHDTPLSEVLERRAYWIEVMFTPAAIFVGKIALALFVARLFVLRRSGEILPLAILGMAGVHYVVFENGADVHIYWPLPFAPYFALALGVVGHSLAVGLGRVARAASSHRSSEPRWRTALAACSLFSASILPDAIRALDYARNTGLRLNDDGHLNLQDFDKTAALRTLAKSIPEEQIVGLHTSVFPNWAQEWVLRRPARIAGGPPPKGHSQHRFVVMDTRFNAGTELSRIARDYAVTAVGPFWLVDGAGQAGQLLSFSLESREPSLIERLFVQAHDPIYSVVRDPFVQWELAVHLGGRAVVPTETPRTAEQWRIAHNVAVHRGDRGRAQALLGQVLDGCDGAVQTRYEDGAELLAVCDAGGVSPEMHLYFRTTARLEPGLRFEVRTRLEAKPRLSWVRLDDKEKKVSPGFTIAPDLWRPGFVYRSVVELRQRPGRERFYGTWERVDGSSPPRAIGRAEPIVLRVLP